MNDIADTAVAAGNFKPLAAALTAAKLVDTLKGAGPFAVFAPTAEAFVKLLAGTGDRLLKDIPKLTEFLTYHVVPVTVMALDVLGMDGQSAKTVNSAALKISMKDGVRLNGSHRIASTLDRRQS